MSALAVYHQTDTEEAKQESEEQEPLVSASVEDDCASHNAEEGK